MSILTPRALKQDVLHERLEPQIPLAPYTSIRIGGTADYFLKPSSLDDMRFAMAFARRHELALHVLGNGTNTLFAGDRFAGLVVYVGPGSQLKRMEIRDQKLYAQGGVSLAALVNFCKAKRFGSLDFLAGIPATLGGALAMNAGIPEAAIGDLVGSVTVMDQEGNIRTLNQSECDFGYRASRIRSRCWLVLEAVLHLNRDTQWDNAALLERRRRQPVGHSSGCVFKNPVQFEHSAGWLIDMCGLKGANVGDAQVSQQHGNFILNRGNALYTDVLSLIDIVREKVYKEFSLELELELEVVSAQSAKFGSGSKGWSLSRTENGFCDLAVD